MSKSETETIREAIAQKVRTQQLEIDRLKKHHEEEIERLNRVLKSWNDADEHRHLVLIAEKDDEIERLKLLLTECADALGESEPFDAKHCRRLIKRARETTTPK